jgi:membrane-bound ClpP family serine protease
MNNVEAVIEESGSGLIRYLETNKYFIGIIGIIVFLTGRTLYIELYEHCSEYLEYKAFKKITLWSIIFLYSRSILHATILSIVVIAAFPGYFLFDKKPVIKPKDPVPPL